MKRSYIRWPLFLVLMLALAFGLSFTSLNHVSKGKDNQDDTNMSIALVNEDEGTQFNQNELDFGDAFVKSIDQNNDHDWYIVSRGVAESGLERNTYDMMIVIPNDFSQKALSMDSESPEQVVLDYKINASDSEAVQAQAEETASSILNEFNRRIIDVYFASVIGNLQDAQDNITEIVEEDAALTYTYNDAVHDPLSGYTDQFSTVKDYTDTSKDSFSGLENTLDSFEEGLTERVGSGEDYQSSIQDTAKQKESNNVLDLEFLEQLNAYNESLRTEDVDAQLQQLQDTNQYINAQLQLNEDGASDGISNIAISAVDVQQRLKVTLETVEAVQGNFNIDDFQKGVRDRLSTIIGDAFDGRNDLTDLLSDQDERMQEKIEDQISGIPSMDKGMIGNTDLSPEMIKEIQNVIEVTNKYNDEFEQVAYRIRDKSILPDINRLKKHLHEYGVTMTDTVELPESENLPESERVKFEIDNIPEGFELTNLQLPNTEEEKGENGEATFPYQSGKFTVELTLKLIDVDEEIEVYEPKEWGWEIEPTDEENKEDDEEEEKTAKINADENAVTELPKTPLVATTTVEKPEDDEEQNPDDNSENVQTEEETNNHENDAAENDGDNQKAEESSETDDGENGNGEDNSGESGDNEDSSGKESSGENNESADGEDQGEDGETETEEVEIVNHKITRKVKEPLKDSEIDMSTQSLINAAENTIAPYQKLLSLYEAYFGIPLTCEDIEEDCESVGNGDLREVATDGSLYSLFNEDVGDLLTGHIAKRVTDDVENEISGPLSQLDRRIDTYQQFVNETSQNADELVNTISDTREQAGILNDNLEQMVNNISDWREQSLNLVESQTEIQANNDEEQMAVMTLGDEFQPLLAQSQSLAERASNNLNEAETVYRTFEQIDEQADSIQESGTTLVQQAEDLSVNMTDQLLEDQEFADNFADVMANSRIGERQNEDLYDFLSNPVDAQNDGVIIERDTFTPYFLVLTCFIVALFTAYVISTANQRRMAGGQFEKESSLIESNSLITGITAGIGVLEGLAIGLVSAHFLNVAGGSLVLWTGLMILIMLTMVLVSAYLLRQLKMIGMFILLAVMSMYLFFSNALESSLTGFGQLNAFSPLQYVETLLARAMQGDSNYQLIMFSMIGIALLAALANLLVVNRFGRKKMEGDEDAA